MITIIYLVYGFAFLLLGMLAMLQARTPFSVFPSRPMWFLSLFALLHGTHEWVEMIAITTVGSPMTEFGLVGVVDLLLLSLSFSLLAAFGVDLLTRGRKLRWTLAIPVALYVIWLSTVALMFLFESSEKWQNTAYATARYQLGFPATILAALGLRITTRRNAAIWKRMNRKTTATAVMFLLYGIFAGLIVNPVPFFPGEWLNTASFLKLTGIPVMVPRAIFAVSIGFFLSEAFVVEIGRIHLQMENQRKEFLAIIAHDLRSPITAISLSAELLQMASAKNGYDPAQLAFIVNRISAAATSLDRLVSDLLDSSLIEINRISLKKERIEWLSFIRQLIERKGGIMQGHPLKLQIATSQENVWIEADPGRVGQIMDNLLSNAAKYASPESDIEVRVDKIQNEVVVAVINQGPGIAPEEIPLIFTRFHRSLAARKGQLPGLGLGLFIVKGLTEAHGGRAWAESNPGHDTIFRFSLPCAVT